MVTLSTSDRAHLHEKEFISKSLLCGFQNARAFLVMERFLQLSCGVVLEFRLIPGVLMFGRGSEP